LVAATFGRRDYGRRNLVAGTMVAAIWSPERRHLVAATFWSPQFGRRDIWSPGHMVAAIWSPELWSPQFGRRNYGRRNMVAATFGRRDIMVAAIWSPELGSPQFGRRDIMVAAIDFSFLKQKQNAFALGF
jgi:hypothetical protein